MRFNSALATPHCCRAKCRACRRRASSVLVRICSNAGTSTSPSWRVRSKSRSVSAAASAAPANSPRACCTLKHVEIGLGHGEHRIVQGGPIGRLLRPHDLLLRQGLEQGVAQREHGIRPAAEKERALAAVEDGALNELILTIVPIVVGSGENGRQPQNLGLLQLRGADADPHRRRLHVERLCAFAAPARNTHPSSAASQATERIVFCEESIGGLCNAARTLGADEGAPPRGVVYRPGFSRN